PTAKVGATHVFRLNTPLCRVRLRCPAAEDFEPLLLQTRRRLGISGYSRAGSDPVHLLSYRGTTGLAARIRGITGEGGDRHGALGDRDHRCGQHGPRDNMALRLTSDSAVAPTAAARDAGGRWRVLVRRGLPVAGVFIVTVLVAVIGAYVHESNRRGAVSL